MRGSSLKVPIPGLWGLLEPLGGFCIWPSIMLCSPRKADCEIHQFNLFLLFLISRRFSCYTE